MRGRAGDDARVYRACGVSLVGGRVLLANPVRPLAAALASMFVIEPKIQKKQNVWRDPKKPGMK